MKQVNVIATYLCRYKFTLLFLTEARHFYLFPIVHIVGLIHSAPCKMVTRGRTADGACSWISSSAKRKNGWSCTSTSSTCPYWREKRQFRLSTYTQPKCCLNWFSFPIDCTAHITRNGSQRKGYIHKKLKKRRHSLKIHVFLYVMPCHLLDRILNTAWRNRHFNLASHKPTLFHK
jgi:hypothetical protein